MFIIVGFVRGKIKIHMDENAENQITQYHVSKYITIEVKG